MHVNRSDLAMLSGDVSTGFIGGLEQQCVSLSNTDIARNCCIVGVRVTRVIRHAPVYAVMCCTYAGIKLPLAVKITLCVHALVALVSISRPSPNSF